MRNKEIVGCSVKLEARLRRDGRDWLAWCPCLDVTTQARTKKKVLESLGEAIELWFESCIDSGVLDTALEEVGFKEVPAGEEISQSPNVVRVQMLISEMSVSKFHSSYDRNRNYSIEGIIPIPAHLAAMQLGDFAHARS